MTAAHPGPDELALHAYFGERDRVDGRLVADALLDLYAEQRVEASVLMRGAEGFGRLRHLRHLRREDLLSLSEDLPVATVAVDRAERIEALLGPAGELLRRGLIALQPVQRLPADPGTGGPALPESAALTIELGRRARVGRTPAHVAVCELLHREGIAGATVLLGVDGTRRGQRTRARFFSVNSEVPMTITAVGSGERIGAVLPRLRELLGGDPLLLASPVQICKRDGEALGRPSPLPDADDGGLERWQKLTVYTAQSALHDGVPISSAIIRGLRRRRAAGATSLRGVWGFHGDHPPHGDRLLALRRRVPVVTTWIDTPSQIAEGFAVIDELTAQTGLVTCETVPAMQAMDGQQLVGGLRLSSPPA